MLFVLVSAELQPYDLMRSKFGMAASTTFKHHTVSNAVNVVTNAYAEPFMSFEIARKYTLQQCYSIVGDLMYYGPIWDGRGIYSRTTISTTSEVPSHSSTMVWKHLYHGSSSFGSYRRRYNVVGDLMRPSETAAIATLAPYLI